MRFEVVDGHPYVAQTCMGCGFLRRYRAWERSWDPAATTRAEASGDRAVRGHP